MKEHLGTILQAIGALIIIWNTIKLSELVNKYMNKYLELKSFTNGLLMAVGLNESQVEEVFNGIERGAVSIKVNKKNDLANVIITGECDDEENN